MICINTAISNEGAGIGFAIPIYIARPIMEQALAGVPLSRPWIGIRYTSLDRRSASQNNLPVFQGAWLTPGAEPAVVPGSPAEAAGFTDGDIVVKVEGRVSAELDPLPELHDQVLTGGSMVHE